MSTEGMTQQREPGSTVFVNTQYKATGVTSRRSAESGWSIAITNIFNFLFGCRHSNLSRVFTIRRRSYRVCCDCGAEFDYSLAAMSTSRAQVQRGAPMITNAVNKAAL